MNFKPQAKPLSFTGHAVAANQWSIGWTVAQATPGNAPRVGQDRPAAIGIYGLLAGARHVGIGR